jgi:hypothetical protein
MFSPEAIIDSVQNAKKQVVNTFVVDTTIKAGLIEVIDAQTEFTKTVAKNMLTFGQLAVKNFPVPAAK